MWRLIICYKGVERWANKSGTREQMLAEIDMLPYRTHKEVAWAALVRDRSAGLSGQH